LRKTGLDPEFLAMVYESPPAVAPAAERVWPSHRRVPVWNRLGYCLLDVRHEGTEGPMGMITESPSRRWTAEPDLLRCVHCLGPLGESAQGLACASCGADFPVRDGVLVVE